MQRALSWLGWLLLATSFVWFVRLGAPRNPSVAERTPAARGALPLVVVLDPGHGGQDSGATCGAVLEKDLNLDIAVRAEALLRAAGFTTVLTRTSDRYVSLGERASLGNRQDKSLFISIHFNDSAGSTTSGVETYYALRQSIAPSGFFSWLPFLQPAASAPLRAQSESLARFVQAALVEQTQAANRGTKSEQFYVIAHLRHPAALVEGGFLTNKSDVTRLAKPEYRQRIALAIRDGVRHYRDTLRASNPTLTLAAAGTE